ncbi:hypothetical protein B0T22DRAFT_266772 [Podospora appendiculata]|uniref:ADP-ribose 1''-phosphate phosphatase n=1 Tax=Podospora appendiculata TaxID=314037 RepID=A0AAE1C9D4_9PEZI|nr:hypothetical protein B0T22DRAFT_266772 [Podospora appendiculata]
MPTKRTAESNGQDNTRRQFKQTKLNFGRPQQRPQLVQGGAGPTGLPTAPNEDKGDAKSQNKTKSLKPDPEDLEETSAVRSTPADDGDSDGDDADLTTATATAPTSPPEQPAPSKRPRPTKSLRVIDKIGDLFDAPPRTVLIHACNCTGSWGGGIALAFKKAYPAAYEVYNARCKRSTPDRLVGKALLIPPPALPVSPAAGSREAQQQHYIGCLFTSKRYGRARDSPEEILKATGPAMRHLMRQIAAEGGRVGEIRMCQINSGLFDVPWPLSRSAIQSLELREEDVAEHLELPVDIVAYSRD